MGRESKIIMYSMIAFVSLWTMSQNAIGGSSDSSEATAVIATYEREGQGPSERARPNQERASQEAHTPSAKADHNLPAKFEQTNPVEARQQIKLSEMKSKSKENVSTWDRLRGLIGIAFLLFVCWLMSNNRKVIPWRIVLWGMGLQFLLGLFVMRTELGRYFFSGVNGVVMKLLAFSESGSSFIFGNLAKGFNVPVGAGGAMGPVASSGDVAAVGAYFAFNVLPTIIFFSSLLTALYHMGIMERIVSGVAWVMRVTMKTSGSETLSASGNIFVGQTEAPLLVKPYINGMTQSELMTVMTGGFATVAGGVMAAYAGLLKTYFPDIAGHLLAASIMSAPAALVCAKLIIPEPDPTKSETYGEVKDKLEKVDVNLIGAASRGASEGLQLALNVGAMLIAFLALVAMINYLFGLASFYQHSVALEELTAAINAAFAATPDLLKTVPGCMASDVAWDQSAACIGEINTWLAGSPQSGAVVAPELWKVYTLQYLLGTLIQPIAYLMGVNWEQAEYVGQLIGIKTILNEFVGYITMGGMFEQGQLSGRSAVIAIYALCGFANIGSIGIQIAGIGGIAPQRRDDLAKLAIRAMLAGTIAAMLTGTVAGLLY